VLQQQFTHLEIDPSEILIEFKIKMEKIY